jgi:organic radical activating enzyme
LYIYGAGLYAQRTYRLLTEHDIGVDAFVVTFDDNCDRSMFSAPIVLAKDTDFDDVLLIIGANRHNTIEIKKYLAENTNCDVSGVLAACEILDHVTLEEAFLTRPTIEITTVLGCRVNCRYCPQSVLIHEYFKENRERARVMTMELFEACLSHMPDDCIVQVCGMAEPFLNKACSDMIVKAHRAGKHVEVYTTLVGATRADIEKIWDLPLDYVNIHLPDKEGNADIPVTDEYLALLARVMSHIRPDGKHFVNLCNSQGDADERASAVCGDRFENLSVLHDRAGNLDAKPGLLHKENRHGALSCSLCGQNLTHNVLLPDGTLLLCCMDYGMKHVIGNLADSSYDELMAGSEIERVKRGMQGDESVDILCRSCSQASRVG